MRALLLVGALLAAAPATAAAAPARMLVTADEWMLLTSRRAIPAGRLEVQLYNRGEDAHDLAARRVDRTGKRVGRTFRVRETRPDGLGEATWRLRSGKYSLWCTLPGHRAAVRLGYAYAAAGNTGDLASTPTVTAARAKSRLVYLNRNGATITPGARGTTLIAIPVCAS